MYEDEEPQIPKSMSDLLKAPTRKRGPTSRRAFFVQQLADLMGYPFKVVLRETFYPAPFTETEISTIYHEAKAWRLNPPALAWKLIRQQQAKIKAQLAQDTTKS